MGFGRVVFGEDVEFLLVAEAAEPAGEHADGREFSARAARACFLFEALLFLERQGAGFGVGFLAARAVDLALLVDHLGRDR